MESLPLTTKTSFLTATTHFPWLPSSNRTTTTRRTVYLNQRKINKVFASSSHSYDEQKKPKLDNEDLMELKFGRLLGEDPKLTLAKVFFILLLNFNFAFFYECFMYLSLSLLYLLF